LHWSWERDPERIGAAVLRRLKLGLDISGRDYSNSRRWLVEWRRKLWSLFREVDLLLTPTVPIVAPLRKDSADMIEITRAMARFTSGIGAAGVPSISLPCGFGEGGMPIGV
jgi:aspartyl-tRNA(Asn)/glutamyl-tRNA(Gln) amidotransferase subunit A